ncbi:NHL domain-containing thioredoxin family protein [Nocardioides mesophilus]|uniref:Redoxin domain-containing protein n=1 Tax=Nocardioides mesophilus TaxID=433659 RepID=A0A7G9RF78_9ACTN|nr:NHL domain-containing thioredoxin family protein [Nocardioides mesophilus]QNN54253.1 redoxin domain-containing protein [Nocardioides mesophilus]
MSSGRTARVRAPELRGRGWLNTAAPLTLEELRGRFTLLDFWTFCCVNCLHVLDEMRELEERYAGELVVVGVHSPKFVHEADPDALRAAVERYDVHHPVLDDPELETWQAYTARAWPTLVLIDPEGYVVAQYAGEGHAHAIDALLVELRAEHLAKGTLQPGDSPYVAPPVVEGDLRFPAKAVRLPGGTILVADAGHHSLVELAADGESVVRRIGSGDKGSADGAAAHASFNEPNGLCLLPDEVEAAAGYDVVVADTVNHLLRGVCLDTGEVRTLAGTGHQWMQGDGPGNEGSLSSPWDVVWWQDRVWVSMAGIHQLWSFDPLTGGVAVAAGTTHEGLVDGPAAQAWFAQTSGLAVDAAGSPGGRLWIADSETSSLRFVEDGEVHTAVGRGLFDFGFVDGPADQALLQHPLGVAVLPDGSVAVADTYNGAVRRWDPAAGTLSTLARGLAEPSGLLLDGDTLLVVESAAHRLTRVPLGAGLLVDGFAHTTRRPVTEVAPGELELVVSFEPPPGQKVDDRFGPSAQLVVGATPPALLKAGEGRGTDLSRTLVLDPQVGDGVLHVAARAASCDSDGGEGAACHMHQQDWGVPVRIVEGAATRLVLPLSGR